MCIRDRSCALSERQFPRGHSSQLRPKHSIKRLSRIGRGFVEGSWDEFVTHTPTGDLLLLQNGMVDHVNYGTTRLRYVYQGQCRNHGGSRVGLACVEPVGFVCHKRLGTGSTLPFSIETTVRPYHCRSSVHEVVWSYVMTHTPTCWPVLFRMFKAKTKHVASVQYCCKLAWLIMLTMVDHVNYGKTRLRYVYQGQCRNHGGSRVRLACVEPVGFVCHKRFGTVSTLPFSIETTVRPYHCRRLVHDLMSWPTPQPIDQCSSECSKQKQNMLPAFSPSGRGRRCDHRPFTPRFLS